jgi:hypothetical protein
MLIVGLAGDGPGGAQDTMTVVRGTTILNLLMTSTDPACLPNPMENRFYGSGTILAGQDRVTVLSRGAGGVPHTSGAPISIELRTAHVNDHNLLSPVEEGLSSTVTIGNEQLKVRDVPSRHFHTSGANLAAGPNGSTTLLRVSDADVIDDGDIMRVDSELMAVLRADPACTLQPTAATIESMEMGETVVDVNDIGDFSVGCTIKIGTEEMRLDQLLPADLGAIPPRPEDTMTVLRAYNDTGETTHPAGAVTVGLDSARVVRGMYASGQVDHSNGIAIFELTPEANTVRFQRLSGIEPHGLNAPILDVDGLGAYQLDVTTTAPTTIATIGEFVGPSGAQTTFDVSNSSALQPNWVIIANNEKMRVVSVGSGTVTVARAVHGTSLGSHQVDTPIRGPVLIEFSYGLNGAFLGSTGRAADCSGSPPLWLVEGVTWTCDTSGVPLGATGFGPLGYVELAGITLLPQTPVQTVLVESSLIDVSGNTIPANGASSSVRVVKCGDVNGNRTTNNADAVLILRAVFGLDPVNPGTMDINLNGSVNNVDAVFVQRVFFIAEPQTGLKRCLPSVP